jgi:hypothetical protein
MICKWHGHPNAYSLHEEYWAGEDVAIDVAERGNAHCDEEEGVQSAPARQQIVDRDMVDERNPEAELGGA